MLSQTVHFYKRKTKSMKRVLLLFVLLLTVGLSAFAQTTHTVTGKVLDENGQGYPGAGVTVKGTQIGTVTDANGDFMLSVPDGSDEFMIQAIGYNSRDVKETNGTLTVKLQPTSKQLEGTVVTALAIKREKRELGYTSTTVDAEELTEGNNTSPLSALQGKVAGANITSSTGGPGGSTRIILRGEKSILKDNNALIVIDGVIVNNYDRTSDPSGLAQVDFGNSANDIDPDEIASITVLEGPAAAALYGASGANGAVMITTKAGKHREENKKSKMEVTYKATFTQSDVLKYPQMQQQFGQGSIYTGILDDRQDNFSWGLPFANNDVLKPWGQIIDGKQLVKPYVDQPNSMKEFFNHGQDLNNFVSVSGGSDKSTYYLSLTSLNSNGVVPNTFYNKYSVRFNATTQLSNNFYSTININYINSYSSAENTGQSTGGIMQALLQIPTDIPIGELKNLSNPFYSMDFTDANGVQRYGYFGAYAKNPFWVADNYKNINKTDRVLGDYTLGYKKGDFNLFNRTGIDATNDRSFYETPSLNVQPVDQTGLYAGNDYINPGGFQQNNYTAVHFYNDLIADYKHDLNNNFGLDALVGNNVIMKHDEVLDANINPGTNGLVIPYFYNFTNNTGPISVTDPITNQRTFAVYADIKLNYQKELYLDLTGRNEWTSTLITGQNSYFYPGANASWVFTERLKGNFKDKVLNYGKIRIGTAGVSNDAIPYANNVAGYTQGAINSGFGSIVPPFNAQPAYQIQNTFANPADLKPELTREYETGADLSFLKNRLSLSFTYYNDLTHDLISAIPTAPSSGYLFKYENIGDISNKGEELSINGTPISTKWGLKWDLFGTYTHNVSDVVSLNGGVQQVTLSGGGFQGMDIVAAVGHPYGTFYAATIQTWEGHPVVNATTGLPVPTTTPQLLGSFQPKFQASWGTSLSYKGFKLYALFVTKQGGEYYSETKALMDFVGSAEETTVNNRNPYVWANSVNQVPNTNIYQTNTTKFLPYNYWVNELGQNSLPSQNLVDASYIKLQELSLKYSIPQKYYSKTPFGSLEAGVFGNNLFLWTAKSNKYDDPEEVSSGAIGNAQGFNYNARPSLRNYGVSVKVTF
jgi:TonB-linked SusC/RagA family outer membrane protein